MKGWPSLKRFLLSDLGLSRRKIMVGLDFDGTLSPFVRRPSKARLPSRMRRLIAGLARRPRVRLAIISGRSLKDIKARVGLRGVYFSGNHGLEIQGPGLVWRHPRARAAHGDAKAVARELAGKLELFPGALLENKGLSLSVHYRMARREDHPRIEKLMAKVLGPYRGRLKLASGKMVWEVRPKAAWNKGHALLKIAGSPGKAADLIFVGDDQTDEEGFRVLGPSAVTVRVGPAPKTAARFQIEGQGQVYSLLSLLDRTIP